MPIKKRIDATHADINLATVFCKIFITEVTDVRNWEACEGAKTMLQDGAARFDSQVRSVSGTVPSMMMPGNYTTTFCRTTVLFLEVILDDLKRENPVLAPPTVNDYCKYKGVVDTKDQLSNQQKGPYQNYYLL